MRACAERGEAEYQYTLGLYYAHGKLVPKNLEEAVKWFRKASEQGHDMSKKYLETLLMSVAQPIQDDNATEEVGGEDTASLLRMGNRFYEGKDVPQDYNEALKWYLRAARLGCGEAQFKAAVIYYAAHDYVESFKWFMSVAELEQHPTAQYYVGMFYHRGLGVDKSYSEAAKWYRKAAEGGSIDAIKGLFDLGERWKA